MVCALAWTILIVIGCSLPGSAVPKVPIFPHFDKLVHFIFFFVFTMFWSTYFSYKRKSTMYIIILACILGWQIELYQKYFVIGRSFDLYDILADALGAMAFLGIITYLKRYFSINNQ